MKYTHFLILALIFTWIYACRRPCSRLYLKNATLQTYDSLTDSTAFIEKCASGNNFVNVTDTATAALYMAAGGIYNYAGITYDFSNAGYDYRITIRPSGRVYKITNIRYGEEKANDGCGGSNWTSCSYGYSINDSVYFTPATTHDDNNYGYVPLLID